MPTRRSDRVQWFSASFASLVVRFWLVDPETHKGKLEENDEKIELASWLPDSLEVLINWSLPPTLLHATAIHEMGHIIDFAYGDNALFSTDGKRLSSEQTEMVIDKVTAAIFDILERNGWLKLPPLPRLPARARRAS